MARRDSFDQADDEACQLRRAFPDLEDERRRYALRAALQRGEIPSESLRDARGDPVAERGPVTYDPPRGRKRG